uniref:Dynein assembly factor 3 C-terminal domain-containing protein n=1 Tax=Glossina austeni TaxID=7395 RepID=A0A1A9VY39_GLOAU
MSRLDKHEKTYMVILLLPWELALSLEREGLQNVFRFWLPEEEHVFHIQQYWAERLRKLIGYDHRDGALDWDLNVILKDRESQQISSQVANVNSGKITSMKKYRCRRETGVAFTYPEYEYSKRNKTLAAGPVHYADNYKHRGYVKDMQSSTFSGFGLMTTDERLLRSAHEDIVLFKEKLMNYAIVTNFASIIS